jgi:hypothetical protein
MSSADRSTERTDIGKTDDLDRHRTSARVEVENRFPGRPRQDSNLRTRLRRPVLYPLSYWG